MKHWRFLAVAAVLIIVVVAALPLSSASAAVVCSVDYNIQNDWGSGATVNVAITNAGTTAVNGWTLDWTFPGNQQITNLWNGSYTQSGASVSVSNAAWNGNIAANEGSTSFGFNLAYSGTNAEPTNFVLNGIACNGGTPPTATPVTVVPPTSTPVTVVPPTSTPVTVIPPTSTVVPTSVYQAEDAMLGGGVSVDTNHSGYYGTGFVNFSSSGGYVEYRNVDGGAGGSRTLRFRFALGATSSRTGQLTINGASRNVTFSPTGSWDSWATLDVSANLNAGTSNTIRLQSTGQDLANQDQMEVLGGTIPPTSTPVTVVPPTSTPVTVLPPSPTPGGQHLDNPFVGAVIYRNVDYVASVNTAAGQNPALASRMRQVASYPTFVWMDTIDAVNGDGYYPRSLVGHMEQAVAQGANAIQIVVYDLPNRDCSALASNGELLIAEDGFNRYMNEYINPIASAVAQFPNLRVIAVIEPDSLPNLHTNLSFAKCQEANGPGGYRDGIVYALNTLGAYSNFYSYVDIGHHGWLGWQDSNFLPASQLIADTIKMADKGVNSIDGFVSNTANTSALVEPYHTANQMISGQPARSASFHDWNTYIDELSYAQAWRNRMISLGFPSSVGMLIDTSRNGWGGPNRPAGPSISTDLNTFVDESRIDRRIHKGNWCNQSGAGIGERPTTNPASGVDAYVWVKPPGESDGSSELIPIGPDNPDGKGFDQMCDPTYTGNSLNG
ncbi:MAG: glycoside hydrolase family 6 protein, partial [Anaerolineae bacterium]|nr:glycoside hydrolase family 6 protein [Anaerolineae bacterium]